MQLEKIYIEEAKRIRKVYLTNLASIVERENDIQIYFKMIEDIKNEVEENESNNDQYYMKKLLEINDKIEIIKGLILPHHEKIKGLDESQKILYNRIKEKHPTITDDEIQNEIVPHIIPIDNDFRKRNQNLYKKIIEKQNN